MNYFAQLMQACDHTDENLAKDIGRIDVIQTWRAGLLTPPPYIHATIHASKSRMDPASLARLNHFSPANLAKLLKVTEEQAIYWKTTQHWPIAARYALSALQQTATPDDRPYLNRLRQTHYRVRNGYRPKGTNRTISLKVIARLKALDLVTERDGALTLTRKAKDMLK